MPSASPPAPQITRGAPGQAAMRSCVAACVGSCAACNALLDSRHDGGGLHAAASCLCGLQLEIEAPVATHSGTALSGGYWLLPCTSHRRCSPGQYSGTLAQGSADLAPAGQAALSMRKLRRQHACAQLSALGLSEQFVAERVRLSGARVRRASGPWLREACLRLSGERQAAHCSFTCHGDSLPASVTFVWLLDISVVTCGADEFVCVGCIFLASDHAGQCILIRSVAVEPVADFVLAVAIRAATGLSPADGAIHGSRCQ